MIRLVLLPEGPIVWESHQNSCVCVRSCVRPSPLFLEHFLSSKSQIVKGFCRKSGPKNGPKG